MVTIPVIDEAQLADKRVLVRVDYNVPLTEDGRILDDFRMRVSLPTLKRITKSGARQIILLGHLGNPVVRPGESVERTSAGNRRLRFLPVARHLAKLLKSPGATITEELVPGSPLPGYRITQNIILLENLRFDAGELQAKKEFAVALAKLGDVFIHEAFPEIHRTVASLCQLPKLLPAYGGQRLLDELAYLDHFLDGSAKPSLVVLGGAKVHDKILLINNLLKRVDHFLMGGVMANTILAAQGVDLHQSVVEHDRLALAKDLWSRAPQKFILPLDFVWERDRALDIGPQTAALFGRYITKAKQVFWNGPMGWTDSSREKFSHGSEAVARALAASRATTVVAGGDTLQIIDHYELAAKMTFASSGGGATLAYLAGEPLPGLESLTQGSSTI